MVTVGSVRVPSYHKANPSAGNYPVQNWIIASRWMHIN